MNAKVAFLVETALTEESSSYFDYKSVVVGATMDPQVLLLWGERIEQRLDDSLYVIEVEVKV